MNLKFIEANGVKIAEVVSDGVAINTTQDALDLIANAWYQGASHVILHENSLRPAFFDLKTGMAGEILQKFTNYHMGLVIIGDFDKFESESLKAFIIECNRGRQIAFVSDKDAALTKITS